MIVSKLVRGFLVPAASAFLLCLAGAAPILAQQVAPQYQSFSGQFSPGSIFVEGEAVAKTNVSPNGWLKGDNLALLSGGDALAGVVKPAALPSPCYALYKFDCPAAGNYDLYLRHGYMGNIGPMRYRFVKLGADGKPAVRPGDNDGWLTFDRAAQVMDRQQLGLYRTIEWTKQQRLPLEQGSYFLDLQITGLNPDQASDPTADVWILIDAICLTTQPVAAQWSPAPPDEPAAAAAATPAPAKAAAAAPAKASAAAPQGMPTFVWIEGEATVATDVPTTTGSSLWLKGDDPKMLSGGDALAGFIKPGTLPTPCFARYRFDCPADNTYDLYMRHGMMSELGAMRYRFVKLGADGNAVTEPSDGEGWLRFDADTPVMDSRSIGKDRTIEWSRQQQVRLTAGPYRLDLQVTGLRQGKNPTDDLWIMIDAICLTTPTFEPSGILKPGEHPQPAPPVVDYY